MQAEIRALWNSQRLQNSVAASGGRESPLGPCQKQRPRFPTGGRTVNVLNSDAVFPPKPKLAASAGASPGFFHVRFG
jgi:hypothetical protein